MSCPTRQCSCQLQLKSIRLHLCSCRNSDRFSFQKAEASSIGQRRPLLKRGEFRPAG
jgi:hypothetical protein